MKKPVKLVARIDAQAFVEDVREAIEEVEKEGFYADVQYGLGTTDDGIRTYTALIVGYDQ